ncbi:MAG: low-specificity L-threonine aldolase [Burkholderiaceae bacterium]
MSDYAPSSGAAAAAGPVLVDLRSDTVTRPTPAMRAAIAAVGPDQLGDDVFGDDPSVNALQQRVAALLGKPAALFMASGTQSNLCALLAHCGRGDEYIVGQLAHTYRYEGGGAAVLGGIQPQPLANQPDGTLKLEDIAAAIKPDDPHFARSRLLALENTWSGQVLPTGYAEAACELARSHGLATHLDGARLFNAAIASGRSVAELARPFDSVSICFSKGLGAPIGSMLVGSTELIARAHRVRKMVGGGLRQLGLLAAAADHALTHHVERLADDHALARRLADGLAALPGITVTPPQTNIVYAQLEGGHGGALIDHLKTRGVLATGMTGLRFVTHLDVDAAGIDHAIACVADFLKRA